MGLGFKPAQDRLPWRFRHDEMAIVISGQFTLRDALRVIGIHRDSLEMLSKRRAFFVGLREQIAHPVLPGLHVVKNARSCSPPLQIGPRSKLYEGAHSGSLTFIRSTKPCWHLVAGSAQLTVSST